VRRRRRRAPETSQWASATSGTAAGRKASSQAPPRRPCGQKTLQMLGSTSIFPSVRGPHRRARRPRGRAVVGADAVRIGRCRRPGRGVRPLAAVLRTIGDPPPA
jgi:hypothetical protein